LGVLLRQLPSESRFIRKVGHPSLAWSVEAHLLATVVDLTAGGNWQRGGGKGTRPLPIPRPGQEAQTNSTRMGKARPLAEVQAILDNW